MSFLRSFWFSQTTWNFQIRETGVLTSSTRTNFLERKTNEYDMSNSEVKAEKQQDEGWSNRPVAVGHCARENDRETKPNSRQQFLSVIQLLVPFNEKTRPVLDALSAFRLPMPYCSADGLRRVSFDGCKCNARYVRFYNSFVKTAMV